jgi:hypothetical protein
MTAPPSAEWLAIMQNGGRLLTRKSAAFLGYCRQQANKYGIKGSRVAAGRRALATLAWLMEQYPGSAKLGTFGIEIERTTDGVEHLSIIDVPNGSTGVDQRHWEVCGRKLPYSASLKTAHDIVKRLVDEYGHRALQAESQQGVDWKALSHAVRVGTQAVHRERHLPSTERRAHPGDQNRHAALSGSRRCRIPPIGNGSTSSCIRYTKTRWWPDHVPLGKATRRKAAQRPLMFGYGIVCVVGFSHLCLFLHGPTRFDSAHEWHRTLL